VRAPSTGDAGRTSGAVPDDEGKQGADRGRAPRAGRRADVGGEDAPRLPHERDESSDSGSGALSEIVRRGHDDVERGRSETDKGETTDEVYRRSLRGRTPGPERD